MSVFNSYIEEIAPVDPDSVFGNAGEAMLLDHRDAWNELLNVVTIATAVSARYGESFEAPRLSECKKLFSQELAEEL